MQLTINGTPITVDAIAAQEIVRRHLLNQRNVEVVDVRLKFDAGQLDIKAGEKPIGFYSDAEGKLIAAILLPGEKGSVNWKDALAWAKDQGGDLPNRVEALLLFQRHRDEFQRELYWTNEQYAGDAACAWFQSFSYGYHYYWLKDSEFMARAVRRVSI